MINVTLLNAKNFAKIKGKQAYLHTGLGKGKNVMWWKQDSEGNIYARLSPIAYPEFDGCTQTINDKEFERFLARRLERGIA